MNGATVPPVSHRRRNLVLACVGVLVTAAVHPLAGAAVAGVIAWRAVSFGRAFRITFGAVALALLVYASLMMPSPF